MGNALQDQLLKAGLVNKKQANQARKDKNKENKMQRKGQAAKSEQTKINAEKARVAQVERDRMLNQQQQQVKQEKAIQAQIDQLIEMNRLAEWQGDIAYSFTDANKVRSIHVTEEVQRLLSRGRLAIAKIAERCEPVPLAVAEKIALRDATRVIINVQTEAVSEEDDPYADFKVPDDLLW